MRCRNDYFKNLNIPFVVREWNKLSTEIHNSTSYQQFRKSLLSFIKPTCATVFSIHHLVAVKLSVRFRLAFSNLHEHKLRHNFHNTLNPLYSCSLERETSSHYLLCCYNFSSSVSVVMNDLNLIDPSLCELNETASAIIFFLQWLKEKYIAERQNFAEFYQIYICNQIVWWITVLSVTPILCSIYIIHFVN